MCQICKDAKKYKPADESVENAALRQELLQAVGERLRQGVNPAHFEQVIATLTESQVSERDEELEGRWEFAYRALRVE